MSHEVDIDSWAGTFKILGDPTRLALLAAIHYAGQNTLTVSELAEETGLRVATASAALRAMENNGTVKSQRDGRRIYYGIANDDVHELLHWIGSGHKDSDD
ncbi:ArsR/SmtB family transcription factor [Corynebacterium glucuronolyticum]|uniref:ArsR/SmtB family transcription factor n=1 Tax=Corynebacterium glucuronolyticum TaxID=39791 RepID=UPI0021AF12BC|nr:metalloregulator ArsR/SmtB family transcription factor [Corynebacterium glucuronolyticum]